MAAPDLAQQPGLGYLALLKGELVEHVRRARGAIDAVPDGADEAASTVCVAAMQQLQGVLQTLGLELLDLLADELARVAGLLGALSGERRREALAALRNALDQLRENIERQAAGRGEDAWGLVAALNELRAGSSLPLVSESCLFAPDLEHRLAALAPTKDAASAEIPQVALRQRAVLHRGMFLWFSDREPERGLRKLRSVAQTMRRAAGTALIRELFLAFEALIVGVADSSIAGGGAVRRLIAGADKVLKRLAESGELALAATPPIDLLRSLLFYVATSGSSHHVVQSVRRSNDLRLLAVTGIDGRDQAALRLSTDVRRAQSSLEPAGSRRVTAPLLAASQRLADGLALAQLGTHRRELERLLAAMRRVAAGEEGVRDPLAELEELLTRIRDELGAYDSGMTAGGRAPLPLPASVADYALADIEDVEVEVLETDNEAELFALGIGPISAGGEGSNKEVGAGLEGLAPRDEELRDIFRDEAPEKVEAMRHQYVAWSAQRDDTNALDAVLWVLSSLKSTGRLVGADALSDICWVLEAALRGCRDGTFAVSDDVLGVLDEGVEMVDALVSAHIAGHPVDGDPRAIEQNIYALLSPAAAAELALVAKADGGRPVPESESAPGDLGVLTLFVQEAGDLVDGLADVLRGLEHDPARSAWVLEMRRAARALADAARQAGVVDLVAAGDALDGLLGRVTEVGGALAPGALALVREAIQAFVAAVDALRHERAVQLPALLVERLRAADPNAMTPTIVETDRAPDSGQAPAASDRAPERQSRLSSAKTDALFERAGDTGVSHLLIEEQVAVLREQVGRVEGLLALLRRPARGQPAEVLPPRVATALEDLAGCADRLHEASLAISSHLRGQSHQLGELQHLLAAAFERQGAPTFLDLLLVEVGDRVYALPTAAVESVRRIAAELLPAQGGSLDLRGRSYAFRPLSDALAVPAVGETAEDRPRTIVLAHAGGVVHAYGVDRVLGQRTLLVRPVEVGVDCPRWVSGLVALGADRTARVVDLEALAGG